MIANWIQLVGTFIIIFFIFKIIKFIWRFIIPWKKINLYNRYGGGWALVTGSTDGIGLGYWY